MVAFISISLLAAYEARYVNGLTVKDTWGNYPRVAVLFFVGLIAVRKRLFGNEANRRISFISTILILLIAAMRYIHMIEDAPVVMGLATEQILISLAAVAMGVVARSMAISLAGLSYVVIAVVGVTIGIDWALLLMIPLAHITFFGTMAWVWRPRVASE